MLIEKENIVNWGIAYIQQTRKSNENVKPVLYLDEPWVDASLTLGTAGRIMVLQELLVM
jgi:hypothetical protein